MGIEPIPPFVFLGGTTTSEWDWRKDLIELLTCDYFNPVVEDWNEESKRLEDYAKREASVHLYVITPDAKGTYSIAELTHSAIKNPDRTVYAFLQHGADKQWTEGQERSNKAICDLLASEGCVVSDSLETLAARLNEMLPEST